MIPVPMGVQVWLSTGHTDMRRGFPSLSLQVQEVLRRDPLGGHLFCFRGRRDDLLKVIWHDGQGACLFTKKLERGRFLLPTLADGAVTISTAQLGYLLSGIDWRHPQVIPRRWKVIQTVRERFSCRDCERITQPPAPFHVTSRGFAGPQLLATILFDKFAQHLPLIRSRGIACASQEALLIAQPTLHNRPIIS